MQYIYLLHQIHAWDFLSDIDQQHVFLIISHHTAQQIIHHVHPIPHLSDIYVVLENSNEHLSNWIEKWQKIRGIYQNIPSINKDICTAVKQDNRGVTPMSILSSFEVINNTNQDCLEPSFMYTQLFKQTLLNIES